MIQMSLSYFVSGPFSRRNDEWESLPTILQRNLNHNGVLVDSLKRRGWLCNYILLPPSAKPARFHKTPKSPSFDFSSPKKPSSSYGFHHQRSSQ